MRQSAFDTRAGDALAPCRRHEASSAGTPRIHDARTAGKETRMFEKDLLAGKRILVTGGGSGLGAAMGRRFLELGAELCICGRRLDVAGCGSRRDAARVRRQGHYVPLRHPQRHCRRCDDGHDLAQCALPRIGQQGLPRLSLAKPSSCRSVPLTRRFWRRRYTAPCIARLPRAAAGSRPKRMTSVKTTRAKTARIKTTSITTSAKPFCWSILSTSTITGRAFHGAVRDGEVRRAGDGQESCGGVGTEKAFAPWQSHAEHFHTAARDGPASP